MPTEPLSILIADDSADAAESLAMLLELDGHAVAIALDGTAALATAERVRPRVVILDIGMPGLDGHQVAMRLRGTDWGRGMLIVAVTGHGRDEDRARALAAGFDHHLVKPIDALELAAALPRWLAARG